MKTSCVSPVMSSVTSSVSVGSRNVSNCREKCNGCVLIPVLRSVNSHYVRDDLNKNYFYVLLHDSNIKSQHSRNGNLEVHAVIEMAHAARAAAPS
jgi:hypothetical protein